MEDFQGSTTGSRVSKDQLLAQIKVYNYDFFSWQQRYLAERVRYLTSCDVEQRFAIFLRDQHGMKPVITPGIPKKDIASAIGATPETFSRLMQRLSAEGLVRWEGRALHVAEAFWQRV